MLKESAASPDILLTAILFCIACEDKRMLIKSFWLELLGGVEAAVSNESSS